MGRSSFLGSACRGSAVLAMMLQLGRCCDRPCPVWRADSIPQRAAAPAVPWPCVRLLSSACPAAAAGEMLHAAEPFLERQLHPTVIIRGYVKALEDALKVVDELAFPIDTNDREQMLKIIASCIGTKFTSRFGTLMPVSAGIARGLPSDKSVCWHMILTCDGH